MMEKKYRWLSVAVCVLFISMLFFVAMRYSTGIGSNEQTINAVHTNHNSISVEITKPKQGYLYINDREIIPLFFATIVLGPITIEVTVESTNPVEKVEFYVDDELKYPDYVSQYSWEWDETSSSRYTIKAVAYDDSDSSYDELVTWVFNKASPQPEITQGEAIEILVNDEIIPSGGLWDDFIAFMHPEPLNPGDAVGPLYPSENITVLENTVWLVWIDDFPHLPLEHETRYVYIDANTGEISKKIERWNPVVNSVELWGTVDEYMDKTYWVYSTFSPPNSPNQTTPHDDKEKIEREWQFHETGMQTQLSGALIIEGTGFRSSSADAKNMEGIFKDLGASDDDITHLAPKKDGDADGNNTLKDIEDAIKDVAKKLQPCQWYSVYISGHGRKSDDAIKVGKPGSAEWLTPKKLAKFLCNIKNGTHITVVIDACYSGSFINELKKYPKKIEVVITSTDDTPSVGDIDNNYLARLRKRYPKVEDDPNDADTGSEHTSGLVEDMKELKEKLKQGKITLKQFFQLAQKSAKDKNAGLKNAKYLKWNCEDRLKKPRCSLKQFPNPQIHKSPPTVHQTVPENGASNVSLNSNIVITFNDGMDKSSVESAISIIPPVEYETNWNDYNFSITLTPNIPLLPSTLYTVLVSTDVKDEHEQHMTESYTFSFVTGTIGDIEPPHVEITSPENNIVVHISHLNITGYASDAGSGIARIDYIWEWEGGSANDSRNYDPPRPSISFNIEIFDLQEGWNRVTVGAEDAAGNYGVDSVNIYYVPDGEDTTPPITTKEIGQPNWEDGYVIAPYTPIWLHATDEQSGVAYIYYEIAWDHDEDGIWDETYQETIAADMVEIHTQDWGILHGIIELRWYAVDNAENEEQMHYQQHYVVTD